MCYHNICRSCEQIIGPKIGNVLRKTVDDDGITVCGKPRDGVHYVLTQSLFSSTGYGKLLPLLQHTDRFKATRRCLQQTLNAEAVSQYALGHQRNAQVFILRLVNPDRKDILEEVRRYARLAIGVVLITNDTQRCVAVGIGQVTYGIEISPKTSRFVDIGDRALKVFGNVTTPNYWLVDAIPQCTHIGFGYTSACSYVHLRSSVQFLPSWAPGMSFKRRAEAWNKRTVERIVCSPFDHALKEQVRWVLKNYINSFI